jgi:hypothetical protein
MNNTKKTKNELIKVVMDIEFDIDEAFDIYNFSAKEKLKSKNPEDVVKAYIDAISENLKPFTWYGVDLNVSNINFVGSDKILVKLSKDDIIK